MTDTQNDINRLLVSLAITIDNGFVDDLLR